MSASQNLALSAIAFQFAATLENYQADVAGLLEGPFDPECYRRVSGHVDRMRMYAAALPPVSVAWVEVLIRHFELTHGLWRLQRDPGAVDLPQLHAQLEQAVQRLSRKCAGLMATA
jgi:hypothetical protein